MDAMTRTDPRHLAWVWQFRHDGDPAFIRDTLAAHGLERAFFAGLAALLRGMHGAAQHPNAFLSWVAFIGGPRESRRLLGDVILTQEDIVSKRDFPDGCVPSTWSIDLHYPKKEYAEKFPDNPFISLAKFDARVDRAYGYPVPYRCFYSRNIPNLFMAGRCISVTHEALGTVRVMKTCGMMGEVVGRAASICVQQDCTPRDVYEKHLDELKKLLELPGKAYFGTVGALALDTGEDELRTAVIDPEAGFAYFGTYTQPGQVMQVRLSDFTLADTVTLNPGEDSLWSAVIDPEAGFAYFGTDTSPGQVVKMLLFEMPHRLYLPAAFESAARR